MSVDLFTFFNQLCHYSLFKNKKIKRKLRIPDILRGNTLIINWFPSQKLPVLRNEFHVIWNMDNYIAVYIHIYFNIS